MSTENKRKSNNKNQFIGALFIGFFIGSFFTTLLIGTQESETHITIVYSSEKAKWMTIAYTNFIDYWETEYPDHKIKIDMHPYGSSDSVISILNNEIEPTIWSPASSIWMPLLNTKWLDAGYVNPIVNISEAIKIIFSPVVIATWDSYLKEHPMDSFSDLHALCVSGDLKMAHTDPKLSNSGFMSTIMALSAFSGVIAEDLSINDLKNKETQKWLTEYESAAAFYGKSTGFLARSMKDGGSNTLTVALLYENLILNINEEISNDKVVAVYPEEGLLYSDHPFCILDADWISADQKMVANEFLVFLNKTSTIKTAIETGFRPIDKSISLDDYNDIFNLNNGVVKTITVPELHTPKGEVLLKIPDVWELCKNTI